MNTKKDSGYCGLFRGNFMRISGNILGALLAAVLIITPAFSMGFFSKKEKPKDEKPVVRRPVAPPPEQILVTGVEIIRYGLIEAEVDKVVKGDQAKSGDKAKDGTEPDNKILLKYYKFNNLTDTIPASRGVFFGFEYKVLGKPAGKTVSLTLQDEIRAESDNEIVASTVFSSQVNEETKIGDINLVAFQFKERDDLFSGTWTFRLLHDDQKLSEKTFLIRKPETGTPHYAEPEKEQPERLPSALTPPSS